MSFLYFARVSTLFSFPIVRRNTEPLPKERLNTSNDTSKKNIKNGWYRLIFVNVIFLITLILSSVFPIKLVSYQDQAFVTFIFLCISIVVVYPVIFSNINSMSEVAMKREIEQQNELLLMQIEKIQEWGIIYLKIKQLKSHKF